MKNNKWFYLIGLIALLTMALFCLRRWDRRPRPNGTALSASPGG